jgi:uncharacterized protein YbbC (DUF1343 family)/uncharacterized lipoprotein YddW (UPF0748 family)
MRINRIILIAVSLIFLSLSGFFSLIPAPGNIDPENIPRADREFRAAWIASVANINWPSKPGLPTDKQKAEAIELLDLLQDNNFNAAVFQVRPQCDALYNSELEPWSYYLTGKQGQAPEPYYDPLEFWIEEAHKRGIELHVWLNPYRAHHPSGGEITEHSIVKRHPELVVKLSSGYWWLDPSLEGTRKHSMAVVMDIVKRYDIDGVHFDDYFYPYPSYNDGDFPDDKSWEIYINSGGDLSRADWRRESVNIFIEDLYDAIKDEKPYVKFGLSPFGIWRPNHPPSIQGFDQYDRLYADAKLWLNEGWIDYFTPQLYWTINRIPQSYPVLLGWWKNENKEERHLWPGISVGRGRDEQGVDENINQIMITRGMLPESPGEVHWSIEAVRNKYYADALKAGPYKNQALVPSSPWLDDDEPEEPEISTFTTDRQLIVSWKHEYPADVFRTVIYYRYDNNWNYKIMNQDDPSFAVPFYDVNFSSLGRRNIADVENVEELLSPLTFVAVSAVDRVGNESELSIFKVNEIPGTAAPTKEEISDRYNSIREERRMTRKPPAVKLGIEVLVEDSLHLIKGKRVGLITNPSAVGSGLRSDIDILAGTEGVNLAALFGAEHGVRGAKQGRIKQEGEIDPVTGIPVYSMYGDSFAPKKKWLEKIDVMLFDIQGVGSAWYTFKYSMSYAMEACAKAGIPFIVLDRPNPLGGRVVEGPYLNLGSIFRHKLPLRHGMTYGELAKMWNDTEDFGADLTVVRMEGWRRSMTWDDTGLDWIMPSPNMGTFETAVVYPGQCLFERMNISEGRGTTKPFLITGTTWIDCEKAVKDLNSREIRGARFRPVYFIPKRAGVGSNPRGKPWNKMSAGVEIMLEDYKAYRSVESALNIIDAYRKTNPDSLNWSPPETIKLLDKPGMTVEKVIEQCQNEVQDFIELRRKYFLYR